MESSDFGYGSPAAITLGPDPCQVEPREPIYSSPLAFGNGQ